MEIVTEIKKSSKWYYFYNKDVLVGRCRLISVTPKSAILASFIIYKKYRNQGFGKRLLKKVCKSTTKSIMLWVAKDNNIAFNLYLSCGFVRIGELDDTFVMYRKRVVVKRNGPGGSKVMSKLC